MVRGVSRPVRRGRIAFAAVLAFAIGLSTHAWAETKTWTAGGTTVTWDDAGNWDPSGVPTYLDRAIFPVGGFSPPGPYPTITLSATSTANDVWFKNNYTLTAGTLTLTSGQVLADFSTDVVISSRLSGTAGLTKLGGGMIRLSDNANDFTGPTTISNGGIVVSGQGALGADSSAIRIGQSNSINTNVIGFPGGSLVLDGLTAPITITRNIDATGNGPSGRDFALVTYGSVTLAGIVSTGSEAPSLLRNTRIGPAIGTLTLPGTLNVLGTAGTTITTMGGLNSTAVGNTRLSGTLAGTGTLEKAGSGTLFLEPAATAGFAGRFRVGGSASIGQSSVRVTSGTASDGTSIFGTANGGTSTAPLDMNTGVLEIRSDSGIAFGKNVYLRGTSTFFAGPAPGGAGVSGTFTLGTFTLVANTTQTFNSRNGYGFTFGSWTQDSSNNNSTITNNLGGTLTFTGNAWNNSDNSAQTLTINGNGNTVIAGGINSGTQANRNLTKAGTGLLTIAGTATTLNNNVNIQAGAIMVTDFRSLNNNAGTINLGNSGTAGSLIFGVTGSTATAAGLTGTNKVINLNGTTGTAGLYASQAGANPVLIQANLTATGAGAKTLTLGGTNTADNLISGVIPNNSATNTTALLKVGPGTWVLSGTNTYTGATTISDGTLKLRSNAAAAGVLPDANAITFNATNGYAGGTLEYAWVSGGTTSESLGALTATAGANTIRLTPGSGTASLVFSSLGTIGDAATVNVAGATATSTVTLTGVTTGVVAPHFFFSGSNFAYSNTGVLTAPVYGTDSGFVNSPAAATIGTGQNNFNITGAISAQTSSTAATLRMSGNQSLTFASGASVLTLRTGAANTDGGILATGGTSTITGGTISTGGSGALIVRVNGASDQLTIGSVFQSTLTGGINKTGTGVLILAGANAQTGATNISQGTLRLSGAGVLSGANVTTNIRQGATLDLGGVGTGSAIGEFNNMGTVTNSASGTVATLTVGNNNGVGTSYGVMQSGAGVLNVTKVGTGAQSWLGLSTYTGTTRIGSTGLVTVDVLADIGTASGIGRGNTSDNAGSLVFDGSTGGLVYAGNLRPLGTGDVGLALGSQSASTNRLFTLAGTGARLSSTVSNNNAVVWSNAGAIVHGVIGPQLITFEGTSTGDNTFNPQLTDAGTGENITSVTKAGAGQWNLGNTTNTYTGATTVNEGILAINAAGALPGTSPLLLAPTSATSVAVFQASGEFTRALASGTVAGANTVTFGGSVASTTGGVGFAAQSSKLVVAIGGTDAPTALTWGSGGFVGTGATQVLVLNSTSALDEVEFRNPINLGASARTINVLDNSNTGADFGTLSGMLSGAGGSLRKIGAGILQVTGANTYTGTTSVEAGALVVSSLGSSASAANTPTSVGISGSGVAMTNANAVTLGNASTTGATLVYAGSGETSDRKIRFNSTTGGPQIHANGVGPLVLTNVANDMGSGAKTLNLRGSNAEANMITSNLADNGGLLNVTVDGAATWILTGSNTYSGTTTAGGGALGIAASGLSPSSKLVITNGVLFAYGGDRTVGGSAADWSNNSTAGFIGDYSLTFDKSLAWLAGANNGTLTNNIAPGKSLTFAQGITANTITANRTLLVDGVGTTVIGDPGLTTTTADGVLITINGGGTLVLGGTANNFNQSGAGIDVDRGTLRMGSQNNAIRAQSGDGGLTLSPEVSAGDVATFDLAGTQQTVNALTATSDGTIIIDNSSATNASFTFGASGSAVNLFTSGTGTYSITDTGPGRLSIFKTGSAAFTMISGVTLDYSGTTGVTGGGMTLASAVAATTALSVSGSDSLLALTGGITNPGLITNVSVGPGSTLSLLDGVGNSLTNINSLSLGIGGTAATVLRMNFGDSGSDTLGFVGGTLSLGGTESTSSVVTFYLTDIGASSGKRYDLITSSTGGLSSGTYTLGATPGGFTTFNLVTTDTAVYALSGDLITGQSFWTGNLSTTAWNSGTANWATDQDGTAPAESIPGSGSDVVFVADTVTATGTLATTLEQNFRINSLSFQSGTGGTPSTVTIGPGALATNRLEIAPQLATGGTTGITMAADGPAAVTITAPFKLGAAQTWAVASGSQTLTLSGPLLGEAAVTKFGAGTVVLSAAADPTFNSGTTTSVTMTSGTFVIQNAAALGSTANDNLAWINVSGGAFYYDNATAGTVPNPLTLSGGALSAAGVGQTYSGLVTVTAASTIMMRNANSADPTAAARNITLSGGLSGTGTLILDGNNAASGGNQIAGTLTLNQDNSAFTGNWDIRRGSIATNNAAGLGGGSEIRFEYGKIGFTVNAGTPSLSQNVFIASSSTTSVGEFNLAAGIPLVLSGTVTLGGTGGYGELRAFMGDTAPTTITGPVVLANNGGLSTQNNAARLLTVSGQITETGGARTLTINDAAWGGTPGTVLLTNSNAYTGGTTLARGTLRVGDRDALGSGPLSVTAAATLNPVVDINGAAFLDQTLTLGGVLTASSTFGGLTLTGTIVNTNAGGINNSTNGTITITNNVFLSDDIATGRTLTLAGSGLTVVDGMIANADGGGMAGNLTITNTGTTRLTAANTYSGTTTLTGGVIELANASNGGLGAGPLSLNGSTIQPVGGARTLSNAVNLSASSTVSGTESLVLNGELVGTAGNADRTLTNNLTSGTLTIAGGLIVGGSTNTAARTLTVAANAPTVISGPISLGVTPTGTFNNVFTKSGPALVSVTGNSAASSGTFGLTVNINQGILQMTDGSLNTSATGTNGATSIGQSGSLKGVLDVAGGQYRTSTLSAGNAAGGAGAIVVRGGTFATTTPGNAGLQIGGNTGYGYFGMTGGTFTTNRLSLYNAAAATGVAQVFGGGARIAEYLILSNGKAEFTAAGGTVNRVGATNTLSLNFNLAGSINVLNLAGGSIDNTGQSVELGRSTATGTAIMNIASGTLTTNLFTSGTAAGMLGTLNFNGGVLRSSSSAASFLVPATGSGSLSTIVNGAFGTFAGGAFIDTNGFNPTIATSLVAPTGSGVSGLSVTNAGSGYIGAPYVQITDEGGTGTGATGYAVVDLDPASATYGQLTSVVLTNPGINFTGTPTVSLFGGGGSGAVVTPGLLLANTSGGLTKLSTGTLTLTGENTYTGLTTISAGALSIGSGGAAGSILGNVTNNATLIFNRSDASTYGGSITGSGSVTKAGAGTLTLSATHGYAGLTQVTNGTLRLVTTNALPTSGTLQLGNASTAGRLELDGVDQAIASLSAMSTAASATNGLIIPTGRTLTVNGGVTIGTNTDATTVLNGTGGGLLVVNSGGANFLLGAATGANRNIVTTDFSGLASFAAALGSGTLKLGDTNTSTNANQTSFLLATSNTITSAAISVGGNSGSSLHTLTLGSGANILNANALDIGMSGATTNRSSGLVQFAVSDTTGTVRIRGTNGTSRATVRMVDTAANTGSTTTGTLALAGHDADILAGGVSMAVRSGSTGAAVATLTFDRGTLDITTLTMGERTGAGIGNADATVTLGGGTSTIGSLTMAVNTSAGGTAAGTFNISGGSVVVGAGSGTAINMATAAAGRTSTSAFNLTGGSLALAGNIVRSGSAGTETATITLDGGALDLGGFSIGSGAAPISLVARAGSLGSLGELNGGGVLTKTTSGTLTLTGSNAYSGGTQLTAGTLRAGSAFAFGNAGITVGSGATLDLANFAVANPITNEVGTVINAVAFSGTSTVSGSTTFEGNVGGNVAVGAGGIASFNGAVNSLVVNAGGQAIVGTGASLPQATLVNEGILTATQAGPLVIATAISGTGGLQQAGSGVTTLTGASSYTGLTSVTSGTLVVNGSIVSNVAVGSSGVLGGSGSVGMLSGSGLVGPGNSPGILEAVSYDGSTGLDTAFEITAFAPVYNAPTASLNDVLRLTSGTPFPASLTIENVVDVYFETATAGTYDGGFFTELSAVDLLTAVASAQWRFWGRDPAGSQSYGGFSYKPMLDVAGITGFSVQTAARTVNFGSGNVTGSVTQFVIVPEPATLVLAAAGIGLALAMRRRRSAG